MSPTQKAVIVVLMWAIALVARDINDRWHTIRFSPPVVR